jgi:hypothetical protein
MVDLLAPGSSITSSITGGGFEVKSGTSMATPHVAGAWAILKQLIPVASVTQVLDALSTSGTPVLALPGGVYQPRIAVGPAMTALATPVPIVAIETSNVPEGDTGTTSATVVLTLSHASPVPVAIDYVTLGHGATPGVDFVPSPGPVLFPPGVTTRTVGIPVLGDHDSEGDEIIWFEVVRTQHATSPEPQHAIRILDDDGNGFTVSDAAVTEPRTGTASAAFTVSVAPAPTKDLTVSFHTTDGSATAPANYVAISGTLTFAVGQTSQTVLVPVNANGAPDTGKVFHLDLHDSPERPIERARGTAAISEPGFYPVAPCRVLDTRAGPHGPALYAGGTRTIVVGRACAVPVGAIAVSLNVTVVSPTTPGDLRIFPEGIAPPLVSTINYAAGQTRGNNTTVQLSPSGLISVLSAQATGTVDLIVDVNGYFE